jgi:hypothetical protein
MFLIYVLLFSLFLTDSWLSVTAEGIHLYEVQSPIQQVLFSSTVAGRRDVQLSPLTAEPEIIQVGFKCPQCYARLNMMM